MNLAMNTSTGPLDGFTVTDLTRVLAGPYCTLLLADLGARVIKVEQPGMGADARQIGPFIDDESAYFMFVNRNKESIALNLKLPEERETFESLLRTANQSSFSMAPFSAAVSNLLCTVPRLVDDNYLGWRLR